MSISTLLPDTVVIAFGHKSGHGKDASAKAIIDKFGSSYDIRRYAFADALKIELYDTLLQPLHEYWRIVDSNGDYLALPHPSSLFATDKDKLHWVNAHKHELGKQLQEYGTAYRRARNPFYWIDALHNTILRDRPKVALITDLRMPNEALYVQACKGYTVRVNRQGYVNPDRPAHQSETLLDKFLFDYEINVGMDALQGLEQDARDLFELIVAEQQPTIHDLN